jgi:uncharacterized repeat protein (TIGR01451 family)
VEVSRTAGKRWVRAVAGASTVSLLALVGLTSAAPALAQVPAAQANYSGYAAGAVIHTGALNNGTTTLAQLDQAYSGAAVNSQGLNTEIDSQINTVVQPAAPGKYSGAQGSGVELGIGQTNPVLTPQIILDQRAQVTAPPSPSTQDNKISLNGQLNPLLDATLLEGRATAYWNTGGCVLGQDIANGFGHAANAQVVGSGTPSPVVNAPGDLTNTAKLDLVAQTDPSGNQVGNGTGLEASDTQTFAPIGLLGGDVTLTVVGPITLGAVATGVPGDAYAIYPTGGQPILTVEVGGVTLATLTAAQLFGANGVNLTLPGLLSLQLGGPPTVNAAADGTSVTASWNLISLAAGNPLTVGSASIAGLAVAHMEAAATVPAGGIQCPIPVSKTASQQNVNPGDSFTYTITVNNPYNCTLANIKVVDTTTASGGVRYTITGESPTADSNSGGVLTWNNIGSLAPGASTQLTVNVTISSGSSAGTMTETAKVTGSCGVGNAQGTATINVPLSGSVTINVPTISGGTGAALPVTGGLDGRYYAVALLIGLAALGFGRKGIMALIKSKS